MNDRNANLFFNNNGEEVAVITLNDEEGNEVEAAVMAVFQLEEQYPDYEFAVLMPMEQDEEAIESGQGEVLIFRYFEDEDGDPNFEPIEDDDIAQTAVEAFQSMIDNGDINIEFSEDESEDEEEVSTASVGGNSIDLGDVVVHLDDINRLSAIYIVYRQRDIFWVSLFQIIYVLLKLFIQKIPGVHNIRK